MNRSDSLNKLNKVSQWDIIIIGGGASGLGIAEDSPTKVIKQRIRSMGGAVENIYALNGKHIPKAQLKQIEDYKYSPAEIINKRIQSPCLNDFIKLL